MTRGRLVALFVACAILGALAGWLVHRWTHPTLEERAHGAADAIKTDTERRAH